MARQGKRLRAIYGGFDRDKAVALEEAIRLAKANARAKFDETIEIAMNLGIDPRHADQMVRGVVGLPNGTGKTVRVGVFARGAKAEEALAAGADVVGADDLAAMVQEGKIEFERCIATPDMMALVGRLGKVLGPRGLMPNPKLGTVTPNVGDAVKAAKAGQVEFRAEKTGIVHAGVGKVSFEVQALEENIRAFADAVKMVKERAVAMFDETVEVAMNLGVDPRHADQMVRGVVNLPNGTGRTVRVAVFARGAKAEEATAAGADVVGAEDLVETVQKGEINFDRCIATPDMMPLVGRLGKVLGPRGLMPNPRVGTVTMDVAAAVKASKGGAVEFRVEKAGIIQAGVGKASFAEPQLVENIRAFADAVQKSRPSGAKGTFIQRVAISSTMGPGVKVDTTTLAGAGGSAT